MEDLQVPKTKKISKLYSEIEWETYKLSSSSTERKYSIHPKGIPIFLPYNKIENNDEYKETDPYSVEENLHSDFHKRRFDSTIFLLRKAFPSGSFKLLDIGCGKGYITNQIKKVFSNSEVSGFDYSLSAIEFACRNFKEIDFYVADAYNPPFSENYFDIIVCNNLWEHVPDPIFLLSKISKILKPGGYLIVSTPNRYQLKNILRVLIGKRINLISKHHVTEYSIGQVEEQLKFANYKTIMIYSPHIVFPFKDKNKLKFSKIFKYLLFTIFYYLLFFYLKLLKSHHLLESTIFYLAKKADNV
jgi:2-polyprenyl-3-methyl-5-hydroxy-6-metoxy-1,4-benzoquinol methylase